MRFGDARSRNCYYIIFVSELQNMSKVTRIPKSHSGDKLNLSKSVRRLKKTSQSEAFSRKTGSHRVLCNTTILSARFYARLSRRSETAQFSLRRAKFPLCRKSGS
jgi:hypothetical protein